MLIFNAIVLLIIVVIDCSLFSFVDLKTSNSLTCFRIGLKNGYTRYRERDRARGRDRKLASRSFSCNRLFKLHGPKYSKCVNGRWDDEMPICIKSGCKPLMTPDNSVIDVQNDGASISLHCMYGFQLVGNREVYCDGLEWDRPLGTCRVSHIRIRTECDFETTDLCGWENDEDNSYAWKRRNGFASFDKVVTGPNHDHTTGKPLMGFYMVAEASGTQNPKVARLVSPIYNQTMSQNACIRMFTHMYGATVGDLNVYIKPSSIHMDVVKTDQRYLLFHTQSALVNRWEEAFMEVKPIDEDFQIVVEAKPSNGIISDIAIDDVALLSGLHCIQFVQNETVFTEEPNGVYDVLSCANRCNETDSKHNATKFRPDMMTGKQVEVCDCHDQCFDLDTCCPDYIDNCLIDSSEGTNLSDTTTEIETDLTRITPSVETNFPSIISTSIQTTISSTMQKTMTSATSTSTSTTTSIPTTSTTTINSTSIPTTKSSTAKLIFSTAKSSRQTIIILKPTTPSSFDPRTTRRLSKVTPAPVPAPTPPKSPTDTNIDKNRNNVSIIIVSLLIATVLGIVCLVIFLLINKKWKPYNIDAIEFKTKYYSNKVDEPLLCNYGDTEPNPVQESRRECVTATANGDEATVQVDVIATQYGDDTKMNNESVTSKDRKKSVGKTKSKQNNKRHNANEDVGLLDSDDEHLDFSMQHEMK